MRSGPLMLALAALAASGAAAQEPERRMLDDAEAAAFRGVGRLNIAGRRFCSATLISEQVAVTAAHCLYHPRTGRAVPLDELRFVAGLRRDEVAALRDVTASSVPLDFVFDESLNLSGVRADIALVALDAPVTAEEAAPLPVGGELAPGDSVTIVSYARDRSQAASIQEGCVVEMVLEAVATVPCAVTFGASGAPVLAGEGDDRRLAGIVSAIGTMEGGGELTFVVRLEPHLAALQAQLDAAPADGP